MPVLRNTTARYESRFGGVNCAPPSAGAGAVTVPALPTAFVIAVIPAALWASLVLVTTRTLYGSAGAALGALAEAVAGRTRARLNRARPTFLLPINCSSLIFDPSGSTPLHKAEDHSCPPSSRAGGRPSSESVQKDARSLSTTRQKTSRMGTIFKKADADVRQKLI